MAALRAADDAISAHLVAGDYASDERDAETSALNDRWVDAIEALSDLTPATLPGLAGKAQAVIAAFDRNVPTQIGATVEDAAEDHVFLAYRLAHDVVGLAGAEPWPDHPAKALFVERHAEYAKEPRPETDWQRRCREETLRLAALGLHRRGGLTVADHQLVAWIARRVAAEMGQDMAERVAALTTIDRAAFGPDFSYEWDHLS